MSTHAQHKFSITIQCDDQAVLYCMRALADYSQQTGLSKIAWGNTTDKDWQRNGHQVTFHFSDPSYRDSFVEQMKRLFIHIVWTEVRRSDFDPARRASRSSEGVS